MKCVFFGLNRCSLDILLKPGIDPPSYYTQNIYIRVFQIERPLNKET